MTKTTARVKTRLRRRRRSRARIFGTKERPRLAVFRSNKHIYAQVIDDTAGRTLIAVDDKLISSSSKNGKENFPKVRLAYLVGRDLAMRAEERRIKQVVFDRAGYLYAGRIKALAEGAREGGLVF